MYQTLSADSTWLYRYAIPIAACIPLSMLIGPMIVMAFRSDGSPAWLAVAAVPTAFLVLLCRYAGRLKTVRLGEDDLLVSGIRRTIRVPLGDVESIFQDRRIGFRPVRVRFRVDTPFGRSITFVPRQPWFPRFLAEDDVVVALRARVANG